MPKKSKKREATVAQTATTEATVAPTTAPEATVAPTTAPEATVAPTTAPEANEAKPSPIVRKHPQLFLKNGEGKEFKFTHFHLPKRAGVVGNVTIDGVETPFQVTSNKGFTKDDTVIHYSWFTLPTGDTGYIAHDYNIVPPPGATYTIHQGVTERKDPERVPKDGTVGAARIEKFKATMTTRKAGGSTADTPEQPSEAPVEQPSEAPAE